MGPFEGGVRVPAVISGGAALIPDSARGGHFGGLIHVVDLHSILLHVCGAEHGVKNKPLDAVDGAAMLNAIFTAASDTTTRPPPPPASPKKWSRHKSPRNEAVLMLDPIGQWHLLNYVLPKRRGQPIFEQPGVCAALRWGKWCDDDCPSCFLQSCCLVKAIALAQHLHSCACQTLWSLTVN